MNNYESLVFLLKQMDRVDVTDVWLNHFHEEGFNEEGRVKCLTCKAIYKVWDEERKIKEDLIIEVDPLGGDTIEDYQFEL